MEPIINPWIFYWASVANNIRTIIGIIVVTLFIAIAILGVSLWLGIEYADSDALYKSIFKICKRCIIGVIVLSVVLAVIPSKTTIYEMVTASYVTPDNISAVEENVTDLISDIVSAIEKQESDE